jgi:hypothetical protein
MREIPNYPDYREDSRHPIRKREIKRIDERASRDVDQFGGDAGDFGQLPAAGQVAIQRDIWVQIVGQRKNELGQITPFYYFQEVYDKYVPVVVNQNPDQLPATVTINVPLPAAINPDPTNPFYGQQFNGGAYGLCYEITVSTAVIVGSIQRLSPGYGQIAVTDPQDPVFGQNGTWLFKDSQVKLFQIVYESWDWIACIAYTPTAPNLLIPPGVFPGQGWLTPCIQGNNTNAFSRQDIDTLALQGKLIYVAKPYTIQQTPAEYGGVGSGGVIGNIISLGVPGLGGQAAMIYPPFAEQFAPNGAGTGYNSPPNPVNPVNERIILAPKNGYEVYLNAAVPVAGGTLTANTVYAYLVTLLVNLNDSPYSQAQVACSAPLCATTTATSQTVQLTFTSQLDGNNALQGNAVNIYRALANPDIPGTFAEGPWYLIGTVASPSGAFNDAGLTGSIPLSFQDIRADPDLAAVVPATMFRQRLSPPYEPGRFILATPLDQPFLAGWLNTAAPTDTYFPLSPPPSGARVIPPGPVLFQDLNMDGRRWENLPTNPLDFPGGFYNSNVAFSNVIPACFQADNIYPVSSLTIIPDVLYAAVTITVSSLAQTFLIVINSSQSGLAPSKTWTGGIPIYNNDGSLAGATALTMQSVAPNVFLLNGNLATPSSGVGEPLIVRFSGGISVFAQISDLAAAFPTLVNPPGPLTTNVTVEFSAPTYSLNVTTAPLGMGGETVVTGVTLVTDTAATFEQLQFVQGRLVKIVSPF